MDIKCSDISKVHIEPFADIKTLVLRGIDLKIESGSRECVTVFGASGCGKTTLLEILTLGQVVTTGSIEINGRNIEKFKQKNRVEFLQKIGYLRQIPLTNVFSRLNVTQNLRVPLKNQKLTPNQRINRVKYLLDEFDLLHRKNFTANQLSGGELQRLGLAISVSAKPEILFLDEPFSDQDFAHTEQITRTLTQLQEEEELSIFIASHNPYIINFATKILQLDNGRISEKKAPIDKNNDTNRSLTKREGNKLFLPPYLFQKNVNLLKMKISTKIQISEYFGPKRSHDEVICYKNPEGVLLIPDQYNDQFLYDEYEFELKNNPRMIILTGKDR